VVALAVLGDALQRVDRAEEDLQVGDAQAVGSESSVPHIRGVVRNVRVVALPDPDFLAGPAPVLVGHLLGAKHRPLFRPQLLDSLGEAVGDKALLGGIGLALVDFPRFGFKPSSSRRNRFSANAMPS